MYRMFLEEYDLADSNNRACFLDTEAGDRSVEFYFHLIFLLFFSRFLHSALTTSRKTLQRAVASHCSTLLSSAV